RHTRFDCDWSSDVCSSDLLAEQAPLGQVAHERRERAVELAELLQMKIEILGMRVIIRMRHFHEGHAVFDQLAGHQALPPEVVAKIGRASCRVRGEGAGVEE